MKKYLVETEDFGTVGCSVSVDDYMSLSFDCVKSVKEVKKDPYEEAWEFVRLIHNPPEESGMTLSEVIDCFGAEWPYVVKEHTYEEAKKIYDEWKEKKDKELNVGDEVRDIDTDFHYIVTKVYPNTMLDTVQVVTGETRVLYKSMVKKTGKFYSEIANLFAK